LTLRPTYWWIRLEIGSSVGLNISPPSLWNGVSNKLENWTPDVGIPTETKDSASDG